jgi:hypothetical protein
MTKGQAGEQRLKLNRGMEFMLRSKSREQKEGNKIFRYAKVISLFSREIHLKFELKINKKPSGEK